LFFLPERLICHHLLIVRDMAYFAVKFGGNCSKDSKITIFFNIQDGGHSSILHPAQMSYLLPLFYGTSKGLLCCKIWWKSLERFKSYSICSIFKVAATNILVLVKKSNATIPSDSIRIDTHVSVKFDDKRLNGSTLIASFRTSRWLTPPS